MYTYNYNIFGDTILLEKEHDGIADAPRSVLKGTHSYQPVYEAVKEGELERAWVLADPAYALEKYANGRVTIQDGVVYYNGEPVHNTLTMRILDMSAEGFNIEPMCLFLDNLRMNPSKRSIDELYSFMDDNQLPISNDGHIMAYKNVRENYYDKHSGTFRNMVGDVCEMSRGEVEDDREKTCSDGLHFCSWKYLEGFWGTSGKTMKVKIHPRDVVSIPTDYDNAKGRCCRYEVVAEMANDDDKLTGAVYDDIIDSAYDLGYNGYYSK